MREIFFATVLALVVGLQNFCGAATISEARFNGNETLIYPVVRLADEAVAQKINGKIQEEILRFVKELQYAAQYNGQKVGGVYMSYEVGSNEAGNTVILERVGKVEK